MNKLYSSELIEFSNPPDATDIFANLPTCIKTKFLEYEVAVLSIYVSCSIVNK